ncbi:long-chain-fatty-acid--CoA ligase [Vulcanisaeta moutnovskia 768-28]|uniref:Long-chain-fatty-acid--CoA ligase n=1 Tax=Vulcanisaeta moutnovskia (strain 768-28) TaxID=985053 RepID=F0QXN5_VULM7|nr:long-chain-fatty-acid--CoA ligase [Vulcanisaeta moutnovskia]ADY02450.1 long-chain-fatty-acid--CoA ligase [Vulcanisaeta moutnovskia 768-28]
MELITKQIGDTEVQLVPERDYVCEIPSDRVWYRYWPPRIPRRMDYPKVPLFNMVEVSAARYPDKDVIIYYGFRIKYSEFWDSILRFSSFLYNLGIDKGDRVAIYMPNTPHWLISFFGILRANAIAVPVNPLAAPDVLEYILRETGAKAIITLSQLLTRLLSIKDRVPSLRYVIVGRYRDYLPEKLELKLPQLMLMDPEVPQGVINWRDAVSFNGSPPQVKVTYEDLGAIPYTSGTTGIPKGVMHSHGTMWASALNAAVWYNTAPSAIVLTVLPIFHVTGLVHSVLVPLYVGATMVLMTTWDRENAIDAIEKYGISHWTSISTMIVDLLAMPGIEKRNLSSLILAGGGGAPMPEAVAKRFKELTGLDYLAGYGLTETFSQTHVNPPHRVKIGSDLGIPQPCTDALVIDPDTKEVLPQGKTGELIIRGPNVFKGYWKKPEETKEAFIEVDGKLYFRTGDVTYMDDEGYFFYVDRIKRMINRAGYKVWPYRVENILYMHPAILEVAVVAIPDLRVGEEVKAYVVLKPEYKGKIKPEDIIQWAKERMSAYEYPRIVEFVDSLPKTATGKIDWKILQEQERKKVGGKQ